MIDEKLRILLQDIGRALSSAMADSTEMNASFSIPDREGYLLYMQVHGAGIDPPDDASVPSPQARKPAKQRSEPDPEFRLTSPDVAFLNSIGIDPTRRIRRRNR